MTAPKITNRRLFFEVALGIVMAIILITALHFWLEHADKVQKQREQEKIERIVDERLKKKLEELDKK